MEKRKATLERITGFIENSNSSIDKLLSNLGWSRDGLLSSHKPQKPVEPNFSGNELEPVNRRKSGSFVEEPFPESFLTENHPCSIKSDMIQTKEVPKSHKDLIVNFTREERLAMYEQAVESTPKQNPPPEFHLSFKKRDNLEKLTSLADIAAYRRDIRRRNQKYRLAKNSLSYQEEMHNLIQLQTEALTEYLGLGQPEAKETEEKPCEKKPEAESRRRRSRTRSRSRERKKRKTSRDRVDDRERRRDREREKRRRSRSRSRSRHRHKSTKSKRDRSRDRSRHKSKR